LRALDEMPPQLGEVVGTPQQRPQQGLGVARAERIDADLRVERVDGPAMLVLGPVVDAQENPLVGQDLDQLVEQGACLGVDPVQVLEDDEQGPVTALREEDVLHGIERAPTALGRIEPDPLLIVDGKR
jgi:hypothetical protein